MDEMIEVSQLYFKKTILPLNVHYIAREEYGEWKLDGHILIAKTTPGYANQYVQGARQPERYFVIQSYSPEKDVASRFSPIVRDQAGQQEQTDKENEVKGNVRKEVYCRNCTDLILFSEMRPFRKDNDVVDMLCPGCGATLVEGE